MMTNHKVQRQFLENYLPAALQEGLDWNAIHQAPDHFVTAEWSHRNADLLFELRQHGRPLYFYLLLEHQSKPDPLMPLRQLEYQIQIWRRHIKKRRKARLPYIHAMVFYTGKDAYRYSLSIKELIDEPAELVLFIRVYLWLNRLFINLISKNLNPWFHITMKCRSAHLRLRLLGFASQHCPSTRHVLLAT